VGYFYDFHGVRQSWDLMGVVYIETSSWMWWGFELDLTGLKGMDDFFTMIYTIEFCTTSNIHEYSMWVNLLIHQ
jgi:hypothetical protein